MSLGTIFGVGLGPGNPRLVSLAAVDVMQSVSSVVVPRSRADADSRALAIARPHLPASCEIKPCLLPMSDDSAKLNEAWDAAAQVLLAEARAGRDVAYLVLGDALLYSTWSYVLRTLQRLAPEVPTCTIPGIPAMAACAAELQVPLAEGREPLLIWPDQPPDDPEPLFSVARNLVFMKAAGHAGTLARVAEKTGASVAAVRNCGFANQEMTTDLSAWEGGREYFTTVLMHLEKKT